MKKKVIYIILESLEVNALETSIWVNMFLKITGFMFKEIIFFRKHFPIWENIDLKHMYYEK